MSVRYITPLLPVGAGTYAFLLGFVLYFSVVGMGVLYCIYYLLAGAGHCIKSREDVGSALMHTGMTVNFKWLSFSFTRE